MNNFNISQEEIVYNIVNVRYIKAMGREVSANYRENSDLYPYGWFSIQDSNKKIEILNEAIEKKCLIKDTLGYLDVIEGVKEKNNEGEER